MNKSDGDDDLRLVVDDRSPPTSFGVRFSGESALKSIVHPIAFARVAALAEGLEIAEVVAADEVERDDMVYCESLLGATALTLVGVTIAPRLRSSKVSCERALKTYEWQR